MFNRDGFHALRFQVGEKFGYTVFYVVGNFRSVFLAGEIPFHIVEILVEQFVCIFVNGIERPQQVDCDVFFHFR